MSEQRVLLTTDLVGGVWDFSLVLARELAGTSDVTLLAFGEPNPSQRDQAAQTVARLVCAPLKLEWMQDSETDVLRTRELVAHMVRVLRPDVLHANQFDAACAEPDVPVVLTVHSDVLSWRRWTYADNDVPPEWRAYAALVREALARADAVVAVSRFLANEVRALYGVDRPIEVVHNGWPPPIAEPRVRTRRMTLVAGRIWDAAKNVLLAAEAARGWDPGEVYLAGEQRHPDHGQSADVPPPLKPIGWLPRAEMDAWLGRATVYLSTARYDPFGLLPLQAALHRCALLLSDIPSYRELWDGAACFFRSNDADDLRSQWRSLFDDQRTLNNFRHQAFERATNRYTPGRTSAAYRSLYANLRRRVVA